MSDKTLCGFCSDRRGTTRPDLPLPLPVCDECYALATVVPPEPESLPEKVYISDEFRRAAGEAEATIVQARPVTKAGGPACRECGTPIQWFKTLHGKSIAMELDFYPLSEIPPRQRWQITHGDTAAHLSGPAEAGHVRVCHFDVCPGRVAPPGPEAARLRSLWKRNSHL